MTTEEKITENVLINAIKALSANYSKEELLDLILQGLDEVVLTNMVQLIINPNYVQTEKVLTDPKRFTQAPEFCTKQAVSQDQVLIGK